MWKRGINMFDSMYDALMDSIKLLPYLFITFVILEFIEHKMSHKNEEILRKNKKFGPILGGALGALPQCGFGAMAANLFSGRVITLGTLIAVFLSTSDEMLPIMISNKTDISILLGIILFKIVIGITIGFIIDLVFKQTNDKHIHEMCVDEHCSCDHHGIFYSSLIHTLKIGFFILIANILINLIIFKVGEDNLSNLMVNKNIFTYFIASLVGLIPNCASSVIITELYLSKIISLGTLMSGLLTGSGIGILLLFKTNKNMKENVSILLLIYFIGVFVGTMVDLFL